MKLLLLLMLGVYLITLRSTNRGRSIRGWPLIVISFAISVVFFTGRLS